MICKICRENHPPQKTTKFDGMGVNSCDTYATRIATLNPDYRHLGPLLASADGMLKFLEILYTWTFQNKNDKNLGIDYSRAMGDIHGFIHNNGIIDKAKGLK
jgi:hypothetical protein